MRERTAEGEAMERRRRRRRIARSVVDDASRLLSGPGLFARRTDRWAIVSRWLQHVRGCLKYRDRTGPPISLSLSLCPPSSLAPTHSLRGSWPCFGGSRARSGFPGPTETHTEGRAPVHLSLRAPLDGEYGHRLMGSSRFSPLSLLPPTSSSFVSSRLFTCSSSTTPSPSLCPVDYGRKFENFLASIRDSTSLCYCFYLLFFEKKHIGENDEYKRTSFAEGIYFYYTYLRKANRWQLWSDGINKISVNFWNVFFQRKRVIIKTKM